jgi:hypothetical protein
MHTISVPRRIPLDDSLERSLRALLVAVVMLVAIGTAAIGDMPQSQGSSIAPWQPIQVAGAALGAQTLELSSQNPPMICLSCSALL